MKKRILIVNDSSFLNTGYAIYGKEILSRLHNSGKYDVAELGCYADINNPQIKNIPWKFYPNAVTNDDNRINQYKANNLNQFGLWRFNRCLADFKPHIVFDIRDYWMFAYQEASPYRKYFNWIVMPATDSAPPKTDWLYTYSNADIVMPYTKWAQNVLSKYCGSKINLFPKVANAGINPDEFYPVPDKTEHKKKYFGEDLSIVGLVMRNQKRKLFPDIMLAYRNYLDIIKSSNPELYKKSYLYLHTSFPEENGWDLPTLLLEYGLLDKTYISYVCRNCKHFAPSKFQGPIIQCDKCKNRSATISGASVGVDTAQLNDIYNLFDLFIQYAICEGFGMPQVEAAACGVQIASVDYSAMTEICNNLNGFSIPIKRTFREMETNADRVYPDINATTKIMIDYFINLSTETKINNSKIIRDLCVNQYTWDNVYAVWEECFDSIDIRKKIPWNSSEISTTNHSNMKVPANLTDAEFVEYICSNIINEPGLIDTANIQCLIKDLSYILTPKNGAIMNTGRQQAIEILEGYLNNKMICEQMRTQPETLVKEDFIQ